MVGVTVAFLPDFDYPANQNHNITTHLDYSGAQIK